MKETVVACDQLTAVAAHARALAAEYDLVAAGMAGDHDRYTRAEVSAALEAVEEVAQRTEDAARAAAHAADLASQLPQLHQSIGEDPELEWERLMTSFHEGGHGVYAHRSYLFVPVNARIEVDRGVLFGTIQRCGQVYARFAKPMDRWGDEDFIEDAGLCLAGCTAAAYWRARCEGADFGRARREFYEDGGRADVAMAREFIGSGREFGMAEDRAFDAVVANWGNIVSLAEMLRDQERLNARQISGVA